MADKMAEQELLDLQQSHLDADERALLALENGTLPEHLSFV